MIAYVDASVLLRVASALVMATHDAALALGAQAHGLPIVGVTRS